MSKKSKAGYCVYYFNHRGIGRSIEETKDYDARKKKLKTNGGDIDYLTCGPDRKKVIKQYNDKIKKR